MVRNDGAPNFGPADFTALDVMPQAIENAKSLFK
jgi:hypothetical protein